jgi:hypothetical protein
MKKNQKIKAAKKLWLKLSSFAKLKELTPRNGFAGSNSF